MRNVRAALSFVLLSLLSSGCITVNVAGAERGALVETVVYGEGGSKILLVDVSGLLLEEAQEGPFGIGGRESPVARLRSELERARAQGDVRALLLRINSPGGTVTASEILYSEVQRFKTETGLPVVAQVMGLGASGGYYVAMAADHVLAHPTSITGSIGVIAAGVSFAGLMEKLGVEDQTLTTGAFKDAGSPLRRMTGEERAQLQGVLDELHARFVEVVVKGRPSLEPARVRELADGRIFGPRQALEAGLIDGIADLPGAVRETERRAGLERSRVVVYHRPRQQRENLYSSTPLAPRSGGAHPLLDAFDLPTFLYLWRPGTR